jgi:hypothetical protein
MHDNVKQMQADPMFQLLVDIDKILSGSRVWGGMDWSYHPIHPVKYLPVKDKVREALDDMYIQYGVEK